MKRSEMIDKLARYINNKIQHRDNWELAKHQAQELLEIVEFKGMIPPHNGHAQFFDFTTPERATDTVMKGYKWEPEDV